MVFPVREKPKIIFWLKDTVKSALSAAPPKASKIIPPDNANWNPATSILLFIYIGTISSPTTKHSPIFVDNELPPGPEIITSFKQSSLSV